MKTETSPNPRRTRMVRKSNNLRCVRTDEKCLERVVSTGLREPVVVVGGRSKVSLISGWTNKNNSYSFYINLV